MSILTHPDIQTLIAQLEAQLQAVFDARHMAGMAAALVYDQEIAWFKGFGYADLEQGVPVDLDTVFDTGSVTKIFTDTLLMQMRDAGCLQLDDPIEKYLPDFRLKSPPGCAYRPPTFRHVAAHIAGVPREPGYVFDGGRPRLPTMDEVLSRVQEMAYIYPPLTAMHYSNLGVYVMGHALARIAGMPYMDCVQQKILAPLGMSLTGWEITDAMQAHFARRYVPVHGGKPRMKAGVVEFGETGAPGGGLNSTARDLARFISFQFQEHHPVLDGASLLEMRLPVWSEPWGGIGIGWWLSRIGGQAAIHHGGSAPGCSAFIQLVPGLKLGFVLLINEMVFSESEMVRSALEQAVPVFERILAQPEIPYVFPPLSQQAMALVGYYHTPEEGWAVQVSIQEDHLSAQLQYADLPLLSFDLAPQGDHRFTIRGSSFDGEPVSFGPGPDGAAECLWLWGLPFSKVTSG